MNRAPDPLRTLVFKGLIRPKQSTNTQFRNIITKFVSAGPGTLQNQARPVNLAGVQLASVTSPTAWWLRPQALCEPTP